MCDKPHPPIIEDSLSINELKQLIEKEKRNESK